MSKADKVRYIDELIEEVFALDDPAVDKSRHQEVRDFVIRAINGDDPKRHLVINIDETASIYILTNLRVIKVDIDAKKIWSSSFVLSGITIETEKLRDDANMQTKLLFQGNSFGLIYPLGDEEPSRFFQAIDDLRVKK